MLHHAKWWTVNGVRSIMVPLSSGLSNPSEVAVQKDMGMVHRYGKKWYKPIGVFNWLADHPSPKLSNHHFCCPYLYNICTSFHAASHLGMLDPKNEGNMFLWNTGNYWPIGRSNIPEDFNLQAKICSNQYNL